MTRTKAEAVSGEGWQERLSRRCNQVLSARCLGGVSDHGVSVQRFGEGDPCGVVRAQGGVELWEDPLLQRRDPSGTDAAKDAGHQPSAGTPPKPEVVLV
jgi:hypothetical protein